MNMHDQSNKNALVIDLHHIYLQINRRPILRDLSMQLPAGKVAVLYGANGAGKSTLLKLLAGLQSQAKVSGSGMILGNPIWPRAAHTRTKLGYMPQHGGLYEELSVRENIEFRLSMLGNSNVKQDARACAAEHGLDQVWQQKVGQLSGGWQQRVAFAVALLTQPALLILDEPSAGVDLEAKAQIWSRIELLKKNGMSVLVSTHDPDEARRADHLINLQAGQIHYVGAPASLIQQLDLCGISIPSTLLSDAQLSTLKNHTACLFIDTHDSMTKIIWQGKTSLQEIGSSLSLEADFFSPSLEDGLRGVLRIAEKKHG